MGWTTPMGTTPRAGMAAELATARRVAPNTPRFPMPASSAPIASSPNASICLLEAERAPLLPAYSVRRSQRAKRSRLTITDEGEAVVVLPLLAPEGIAAELIARHSRWIGRHQQRIREQRHARATRPLLAAGREILFRGELHRVVAIAAIDGRTRATIRIDRTRIVLISSPLEPRSTAEMLESWLRATARTDVEGRVAVRAAEMGLTAKRVTIRDQKTRWGSASGHGTLSFSWRLVMCPPWVLDYVVVHELAHLKVSGHSVRFWRLVEKHHPHSRAARAWLRDHHGELRHALD
jgi:predicted metal-dependent hydrolase